MNHDLSYNPTIYTFLVDYARDYGQADSGGRSIPHLSDTSAKGTTLRINYEGSITRNRSGWHRFGWMALTQ